MRVRLGHVLQASQTRASPEQIASLTAQLLTPDDHPAVCAFLYLYFCLLGPTVSMHVLAQSALPIGAGLGSSAAFAVCLAGGMLRVQDMLAGRGEAAIDAARADIVNRWAFLAEVVVHGQPSGVDNTVATYGGALRFQGGATSTVRLPSLGLLLVNTHVPRSTKTLVSGVRARHDALPAVMGPVLTAMGEIVEAASRGLQAAEASGAVTPAVFAELALLVDMAHSMLRAIGVSHVELERIVASAAGLGFSAKLTGAGGGGCAFVLLPEGAEVARLESELTAHGFAVFRTSIGGPGFTHDS